MSLPPRLGQGIEDEVAKRGWEILNLNNNFDANTALTNADAMVLKKVDVAVEFQLYEDVMPAIMDKFKAANIPVITIDIPAPGATFVGVDNYMPPACGWQMAGAVCAGQVGRSAGPGAAAGRSHGRASCRRSGWTASTTASWRRCRTWTRRKILRQPGGGMREKGMDITRAVLTSHPDAHQILISGIDDISLLGGLAAAQELGREKDCVFFGQGGELEAIPEIREAGQPTTWAASATSSRTTARRW